MNISVNGCIVSDYKHPELIVSILARIVIALVAIIHGYIAWLEIFAWTSRGPKVFKSFPPELFEQTTVMAANQGLYNALLAAGLIWSLCIFDSLWHRRVASCFLLMVCAAGIFGALTASPSIILVQSIPALLGIVLLVVAAKRRQAT